MTTAPFEFYSLWEEINNPNFNSVESHIIKNEEVPYNRFTMTPKRWKENNPENAKKGNIRDYADLIHLVILNNLENINAELIEMKIPQYERLIKLNNMAKKQMELLKNNKSFNNFESIENRINNNLIDTK